MFFTCNNCTYFAISFVKPVISFIAGVPTSYVACLYAVRLCSTYEFTISKQVDNLINVAVVCPDETVNVWAICMFQRFQRNR